MHLELVQTLGDRRVAARQKRGPHAPRLIGQPQVEARRLYLAVCDRLRDADGSFGQHLRDGLRRQNAVA